MSMTIDPLPLEIDVDEELFAVTFTANGEHLISGGFVGVRLWQVADGKQVARMRVGLVWCVAASKDGKWIAAGTKGVFVWDATTCEQVFVDRTGIISDVDFSPDSTRLVTADNTATIWDIGTRRKVRILHHDGLISAAKYSPQGDRIATIADESVLVWDSNDGRLLVDVNVQTRWGRNLLWHNHHLLVVTKDTIVEIDATTGSTVSEWRVPHTDFSAIALHGHFLAYSAQTTATFWDISTYSRLGLNVRLPCEIRSIAYSLNHQFLAAASWKTIIVKDLSCVIFRPIPEPELVIDDAALDAWKRDQLADAEELLSAEVLTSENRHHVLANRALVRARLGQWDAAFVDATESITIQRSLVGYVAKCVALVGKGETDRGCGVCDIASLHFSSDHLSIVLIKIVVLFMTGKHPDAISRIDDLITDSTDLWAHPVLYVVRAYMRLLCGSLLMENSDYERAIQSFEDARITLGNRTHQPPLIVSLISGWEFDCLAITIKQRLCEALFAAGRIKEACESVLRMEDQEIIITESIKTWVSNFKYKCRSKQEDLGDGALNAGQYDVAVTQYTAALSLSPTSPQCLLVKRSRGYAETGKWENALKDANEVIRLDPSSPSGYESKYTALFGIGQHDDARDTFETMLALRPGLKGLRGKLRLASIPRMTRAGDAAAYSSLGAFSMTYSEGEEALGRLLAKLFTSSGDTSILAWTGWPGSFNSCLPANVAVFSRPLSDYIPLAIPDTEMATITTGLRASSLDLNLITKLYDRVNELRPPRFTGQRMTLPCLAFKVRSPVWDGLEGGFHAHAGALEVVAIKTRQNIAESDSLYLVHPWIDFLLDRRVVDVTAEEDGSSNLDGFFDASSDISSASDVDSASFPSTLMDAQMRFLARLRQPFGALLLEPNLENMVEYRRIVSYSLIKVQVEEITSETLNRLIEGVEVFDVI